MFIKLTGLNDDIFYLNPETIVEIDTYTDNENQLEKVFERNKTYYKLKIF